MESPCELQEMFLSPELLAAQQPLPSPGAAGWGLHAG